MIDWLFNNTPFYFMTQSFWRDEGFSYLMAKLPIIDMIQTTAKDFNPPLYYGILHYWMNVFGSSEVAIRSLSLIFFAMSIFVFLLFLVDVLKVPERKATPYLLLYSFNPFLLYYALEARMYSLFALVTLTSFYFLLTKKWKWYGLIALIGFYTHYFFTFVFATQLLYMLLYERAELKKAWKSFVLPALAFLPWLYYILPTMTTKTADFWAKPLSFTQSINTLGILFTGYETVWSFYTKYIVFASFAILGILVFFFTRRIKKDTLFSALLLWSFGAYFGIALISFVKPIFVPRYLIFSAVGLQVLLTYILTHVAPKAKLLITIMLVVITVHYTYNESLYKRKGNVRATLHEISAIAHPNDAIYVSDASLYFTVAYYIRDRKVYIYQAPDQIPYFIGVAILPDDAIVQTLPTYPNKAFILKNDYEYDILSTQ